MRLWRKLHLSLGSYEVPDNHDIEWDARYLWSLRMPLPGWGLWGTLGLAGLLVFGSLGRRSELKRSTAGSVIAIAFLLYLGTMVATVTSGRIRLMLVPLVLPFAGWMLWLLLAHIKPLAARMGSGPGVKLPVLLLALAVAASIVFVPALPAEIRAQKLDGRDMNHARILLERADGLDEAESLVRDLARTYPRDPRVASLSAEVHFRRAGVFLAERSPGLEQAEIELSAAMNLLAPVASDDRIAPVERFRARILAGLCQLRAGTNPGAARRHFETALAWDPTDPIARLGLANALALEAEEYYAQNEPAQARERWVQARDLVRDLRAEGDEEALERREDELNAALGVGDQ